MTGATTPPGVPAAGRHLSPAEVEELNGQAQAVRMLAAVLLTGEPDPDRRRQLAELDAAAAQVARLVRGGAAGSSRAK